MIRSLIAALAISAAALAPAAAQQAGTPAAPAPAAGGLGNIQSANIFDVKPDANEQPGYAEQTNAERAKVQPGNNAPMWRQVNSGEPGYSSLPKSEAPEAGVLIQRFVQYPGSDYTTAGEAWRQVRNHWIIPYGGGLLLIVLVAILLFYAAKGSMKVHDAPTGRRIERFTYFERAAHWVNAAAFVILALSGIVMAFGKFFLLPIMGSALFGWTTWVLKTVHNFVGPVFAVSLAVVLITFAKDNIPRRHDILWLKKGGGLLTGAHVPSHRFNAGEKLMFWGGMLFLGLIAVLSGLFLDKVAPGLDYSRGNMQIAHMIHAVSVIFMTCMIMGHIYLGTIGMQGAFKAMKTGYVDETWAREHHELWYDDVKAGKIPAQRTPDKTAKPRPTRPAGA
ncbi:formate dehydrogenase subunit gamma [Bordetella genomosp. 13]|uniref:Formate dehydrogenase subunit gamma n=1 Tax=Bordetella genomosp. 13 TaxID=463040 RepID=A0A1W6Z6Z2_9BORD|nr:formate dehydrogenase subunit gamma [Bordetella genomosp. 13]ARP93153.1 formate dehydrogenase subunit gamma [Bordetella genomosp. 13]